MSRSLNIGIIGCGRIFKKHFIAINKNSNLSLRAICDTNIKKLNKINLSNINKYTNIDDMLVYEDLDLITICTPSGLHPVHAIKCLKNNNNILIEKPLGTNINEVNKIFNVNKVYKKKIFLVKQNRFNPTILYLKKLIDNNIIKKIYFIQINVIWSRNAKYYSSDKWRGTKKLDGGVLLNQASHYVDLMFWLFGEPLKSLSLSSRNKAKIEMEDNFSTNIFLKKKIHCNFNATTSSFEKNLEGSITICASNCTIKIGGPALNKIEYIETKNNKIKKIKNFEYDISDIYGSGHVKLYDEIQKNLRNLKNKAILGSDGINSLRWILEQYKNKIYAR